jgi:predicted O-linked N-acetylglucosamine transferase (SPINDLY family)
MDTKFNNMPIAKIGLTDYSTAIQPTNESLAEAIVLHNAGQLENAKIIYEEILKVTPNNFDALQLLGTLELQNKNFLKATEYLQSAIKLNNTNSNIFYNLGLSLSEQGHIKEAIEAYKVSLHINNKNYKTLHNLAKLFYDKHQYSDALKFSSEALSIKGDYASAFLIRGNALGKLNKIYAAIKDYNNAIRILPNYADAFFNKANYLTELNEHALALDSYREAYQIKGDYQYLLSLILHNEMKICHWDNHNKLIKLINNKPDNFLSFILLSLVDSLVNSLNSSRSLIRNKYPRNLSLGPIAIRSYKKKLVIGYYSADFREHPVSYLTAELFELHDKSRFELIAFYSGPADSSSMHKRVALAFNKFIDIRMKNDTEVAELSRSLNIDIAIDLTGLTHNSRVGIFACRAAPIQLSYLGYLGTMGAEYYDYLIADKVIIPAINQKYFTEKIVYLPSYQVNDSKRLIADKVFTRNELNLPENGFIFCCFNNNFKITPTTFDGWMRILIAVPDSILFLYAENKWAETNLKIEAEKRGVNQSRLVFGARISRSEYLSRYKVADLFLDTFPYNAGTTASDALWAELPILTLLGESFASRVAASLLNAIGLPELISISQEQYESTAIELAKNPSKFKAIKDKLKHNKFTKPLFNTPEFTKHIETAYWVMYERYQAGLPPDHIYIDI